MMKPHHVVLCLCWLVSVLPGFRENLFGQEQGSSVDARVKEFLQGRENKWDDLNIPSADGQVLYDVIVKNGYVRALEIGTSTGHSGIWIAWALSKTGGKLITIEIDEFRYREALENFRIAGVLPWVDARLGDAHRLVKELNGPFDFVFCDADKEWYVNYLKELYPRMAPGGCYAAHNVSMRWNPHIRAFLEHLDSLPGVETTIRKDSYAGVSLSYLR